jgi:hypothetical protein
MDKQVVLPELPPLTSEEIEPTMMKILCHLYARCEKVATDQAALYNACNALWEGINAINMVAICVRCGLELNNSSCLHFSIAASAELGKAARYIQDMIGIDPFKTWTRH